MASKWQTSLQKAFEWTSCARTWTIPSPTLSSLKAAKSQKCGKNCSLAFAFFMLLCRKGETSAPWVSCRLFGTRFQKKDLCFWKVFLESLCVCWLCWALPADVLINCWVLNRGSGSHPGLFCWPSTGNVVVIGWMLELGCDWSWIPNLPMPLLFWLACGSSY